MTLQDPFTSAAVGISEALHHVRQRLARACARADRPVEAVQLLAVSKTFGADAVRQAVACGQLAFGENYIQEGVDKITALRDVPLQWHCIGPIQGNKTRLVAAHFDWAHAVDRIKIAQRLSEQRPAHLPALQVCIQVNIDAGSNKAGVAPQDALALAHELAALPGIRLRGLMTLPEPAPDFEAAVAVHMRAKALFDDMNAAGMGLDTLSMGMSADLEAAVLAGSTLVRVGSAIFGGRLAP